MKSAPARNSRRFQISPNESRNSCGIWSITGCSCPTEFFDRAILPVVNRRKIPPCQKTATRTDLGKAVRDDTLTRNDDEDPHEIPASAESPPFQNFSFQRFSFIKSPFSPSSGPQP